MKRSFLRTLLVGIAAAVAIGGGSGSTPAAVAFPNDEKTVVHVLNRIGFGPRPGDVEKVQAMGLHAYIEQQLHPERIADAEMSGRLAGLPTIVMSSRDIAEQYARPALEARRERQRAAKDDAAKTDGAPRRSRMPDPTQRAHRVLVELSEHKLLRAAYSDRQLEEVLTDFWFNHFNVDARKGPDRFMLTEYEREAIRPHVLSTFRDLLEATAKSPAMLFYLDNWLSADPQAKAMDARMARRTPRRNRTVSPQRADAQQRVARTKAPRGLNENYGRELLELHTLGVDGGYTQKDVTEVARAFTGWTIQNPRKGGGFRFERRLHDEGRKLVLGQTLEPGRGIEDGEQVLDILASHPATARFIATKLARRFVSDAPPAALVDRASARFRETGGDLREVTRTILTSPEFLSPDTFRAKVKSPLEFVVSAVRATGAEVRQAAALVRALQQLGMPLYQCQPPTGYKDTADAWVSTGALVNRMNFALQLASGQVRGVDVSTGSALRTVPYRPDTLLGGEMSESTHAIIAKATSAPHVVALTLGAPEFQRR